MTVKHKHCYGPCMVAEWNLEPWRQQILTLWDEINLYSMTRGINRFDALTLALREIDKQYTRIDGIPELTAWTEAAPKLSESVLETELRHNSAPILQKALRWSYAIDRAILELPWELRGAFPGVKEGLRAVRFWADVAVVSSANHRVVEEEWRHYGIEDCADVLLSREAGNKLQCVAALRTLGYSEDHILMVGDSPSDRMAAEMNGVLFYPILARHEPESWAKFPEAAERMRGGDYWEYGQRMGEKFLVNLVSESPAAVMPAQA